MIRIEAGLDSLRTVIEMADKADIANVEITPEMIGAGVGVLESLRGVVGDEMIVRDVYIAMSALRSGAGIGGGNIVSLPWKRLEAARVSPIA
jgi:hypothetical protein